MSSAFAIINICMKIKREFFFSFYFLFIKRTIDWSYISERLIDHFEFFTLNMSRY